MKLQGFKNPFGIHVNFPWADFEIQAKQQIPKLQTPFQNQMPLSDLFPLPIQSKIGSGGETSPRHFQLQIATPFRMKFAKEIALNVGESMFSQKKEAESYGLNGIAKKILVGFLKM